VAMPHLKQISALSAICVPHCLQTMLLLSPSLLSRGDAPRGRHGISNVP
jgi:hypothetical protein